MGITLYRKAICVNAWGKHLPEIGRLALWQGAQPLRIDVA
jgi:hypothetical protein